MSILSALLPKQASNDYRGGRIPLYTFLLFLGMATFRSFVHFLKDDSGVNSIATIMTFPMSPDGPDPNRVIYMFSSLWGSQQVIMVLLYLLVLVRYRNLIPLMYALFVLEICFRMVSGNLLHPLTPDYYERTPPGAVGNIPMLVLASLMLFLSLRNSRAVAPAHD